MGGFWMSRLSVMPPSVSSAEELIKMAREIEREAARRYRDLATRMRLRGEAQLAELFDFLSEIEEKHVRKIDDRAIDLLGKAAPDVPIDWPMPEAFEEEDGSSRLLTPYRALALAVRNEDRAFAFYTYVAADAPDGETRRLAEELAKEELEHAHLLRHERRAAFRHEKLQRRLSHDIPQTLRELWVWTAEAESRAARYHYDLASSLRAADPGLANLFMRTADDEDSCAREAEAHTGILRHTQTHVPAPSLEDGLRLLEESFERYSDIAERTKNEVVMNAAQALAERAVKRLSLVSGSIDQADSGGTPPRR